MYEIKHYRGVICNDTEEWWKFWRGIGLSFQNWIWQFVIQAHENLNINGLLLMFTLTKYRGVIFDRTEDLRKIWRKNDLCFQKWHKEFGKFSPGYLEISEWVLWWHTFIQNKKYMSLKFAGKLCVMAVRNGGKFEEELTCQF